MDEVAMIGQDMRACTHTCMHAH